MLPGYRLIFFGVFMTEKTSENTEIAKRRDDALRRALQTPPKPKTESAKRKEKQGAMSAERKND